METAPFESVKAVVNPGTREAATSAFSIGLPASSVQITVTSTLGCKMGWYVGFHDLFEQRFRIVSVIFYGLYL